MASQPRVTKFKIDWDDAKDSENIPPPAENTAMEEGNSQSCSSDAIKMGLSVEKTMAASSNTAMDVS